MGFQKDGRKREDPTKPENIKPTEEAKDLREETPEHIQDLLSD